MTAKIKNWDKFQHYKSGRGKSNGAPPPWIKLYRDLLNDKEWFALDPMAAKFLISLWMLCAETDGVLPDRETLAFRLRIDSTTLAKCLSLCSHWIIDDASSVLASCYQVASPEGEEEGDKDAASSEAHSSVALFPEIEAPEVSQPPKRTPEAELFERGKEVMGQKTGSLISQLLKSKGGSVPLARAAIEQAATKQNPREYIGRIIRGPPQERHSISDPLAGII